MGNNQSLGKGAGSGDGTANKKTLPELVDYIATNYILTQNFQDLEKLSDPKYCDELVILTSKVISQKLNDMEIRYLAQRMKNGVEINEMTKGKVIYLKKKELPRLDVQNATTKRRLCVGIAKFYVKVAHLFAAIVGTINPAYTFVDDAGMKQTVGILNKRAIPEGANAQLTKVGLCSSRINALLNGQDFAQQATTGNGDILIKPSFCGMNAAKKSQGPAAGTKSLENEPGIPELKRLYYDEYYYDLKEGEKQKNDGFSSMSPEMKKVYDADVKRFYTEFTGETKVPDDIKEFSQIKLRDFQRSKGCNPGGAYTKGYTGTLKQQLFKKYADHTKKMIEHTNASQDKLLDVLDEMFKFSYDQVEKKKRVIINPALNDKNIQKLVDKTRALIVELYLTCEKDFVEGLQIYEAIVEKQVLDTSMAQLRSLNDSLDIMGTSEPLSNVDAPKVPAAVAAAGVEPRPRPAAAATADVAQKPVDVPKAAMGEEKRVVTEKVAEAGEALAQEGKKLEEGVMNTVANVMSVRK